MRAQSRFDGSKNVKYSVIPGIVVQSHYKMIGDYKNLPVSEIDRNINEEEQRKLSKTLRFHGFKGKISFWHNPLLEKVVDECSLSPENNAQKEQQLAGKTAMLSFYNTPEGKLAYNIKALN